MQLSKTTKITAVAAAAAMLLSSCLASNSKTTGDLGANKNTGKTINMTVAFGAQQRQQFKAAIKPYAKSQGNDLR